MGKVKHKRLRVSRFSPANPHCNGKVKDRQGNSIPPKSNSTMKQPLNLSSEVSEDDNEVMGEHSLENQFKQGNKGGLKAVKHKISSGAVNERVTGLNMLASFALEPNAAESIMKTKLVALIAPLLRDQNSQVRLGAAGVLRNLCTCGSETVIEMMVQQDVLQPLSQLLKTYETNELFTSVSKQDRSSLVFSNEVANVMDESDPHNLIFIHSTNVLWTLCEYSEEALSIFNQENLVNILLKHINPFEWNYSISLTAADCLLCVSENNPKTASAILPYSETLLSLVLKIISKECDEFSLHFAVVISGVLLNINYCVPGDDNFRQVFVVLQKTLELDAASFFQEFSPQGSGKASVRERFEHVVSAQLVALEILSNVCCSDEDEDDEVEEWVDYNDVSVDDSMDVEEDKSKYFGSVPIEILEGIKFFQLTEMTLGKIIVSLTDFMQTVTEAKESAHEKICQLQIRALQCFQNLVSCLDVEDFGGSEKLYTAWLRIGQISFTNKEQTDPNLLEAGSGAMRAIVQKLSERECPQLSSMSNDELQIIVSSGMSCEIPTVRANLCRMIGTLGCSFIKFSKGTDLPSESYSLLSMITEPLLNVGERDPVLWVRAEALDVIIDLFSDDKTDKLAAHVHLVERLKDIHPQFKAKFSQQKKQLGDHRPLVLTVRDNLVLFIKYKAPRTLKYK